MVGCLTGQIETTGANGNAYILAGNQSIAIAPDGTINQPVAMTAQEKEMFSRVQDFIIDSARQIDQQQGNIIGLL